ncbi:Fructosamine/Ketosamine-3-kinase [Xylariales sp. AK1849]|nr:Fructosamine/Ketosamine-3-kinase [Xylariales sp. AK1849]
MLRGERHSMVAFHAVTPNFAPRPLAWGTFSYKSDLPFFLCHFLEVDGKLPGISKFSEGLAQLHRGSRAPEGKFGFHVPMYNGNIFQDVRWTDTWEECSVNGLKKDLELEQEACGPSDELDALAVPLPEKVVPRLLRPLESAGRSVKPCLVRGDLWPGNTSNDKNSKHPAVFDTAASYAHNKYDIKNMTVPSYPFGRSYMDAYNKHFAISEPRKERGTVWHCILCEGRL